MPAMDDAQISARLTELGIELPPPPKAVASYVPVRMGGSTAYVAGQVPMVDGRVLSPGRLGDQVRIEDAAAAARQGALQALSALHDALGGFDRLARILQVTVFIAATPDFVDHPKVANGASDVLVEVLGEAGQHARAAVGMASLPLGASIEVAVTAEVGPA
jgi:enamine deaminase RidA (YjgF/YER057c/UK114 family)